jgi:CRP-like cAMP-binding protein
MMQTLKSADEDGRGLLRVGSSVSVTVRGGTESVVSQQTSDNLLLDALPGAEIEKLRPHLESSTVIQGDILTHSDQMISHVYFPSSALIGLVIGMEDGTTVEAGLVGAEGMVNLPVFWGRERAPYTAIVLQSGNVLRMRVQLFRSELKSTDSLRESLLRYTNLLFDCAAQRAACNCLHTVEQRTASWLLVTRDCSGRDEFHGTHEFISFVVGLRRAGVTQAIGKFKRSGILLAHRGRIKVTDPESLEQFTCECYGIIKAELDRFRNYSIERRAQEFQHRQSRDSNRSFQ